MSALRFYNAASVIRLRILNGDADKHVTAVPALGMVRYQKDDGTMTDFPLANLSIDTGERVIRAALDAAMLQCQVLTISWQDDANPIPTISPDDIAIETYGNASALHPQIGATGLAMTLTSPERTAIANEIEAQIIDDTDSEKVLEAITNKIAAVNPSLGGLTLAAIAAAVRTDLDANSSRLSTAATNMTTLLGRVTGAVALAADWTSQRATKIDGIKTVTDTVPTTLASDLTALANAIAALDDAAAVEAAIAAMEIEPGLPLIGALQVLCAGIVALTTGAGTTTEAFKSLRNDGQPATKTRITSTNDGTNRTGVVLDLTAEV